MQNTLTLGLSLALLTTHFATAHEPFQKIYFSSSDLIFQDDRFIVIEDGHLIDVRKIEQDDVGMYYYRSWVYGFCPRGHAYGPDGKCNGDDCLFS